MGVSSLFENTVCVCVKNRRGGGGINEKKYYFMLYLAGENILYVYEALVFFFFL